MFKFLLKNCRLCKKTFCADRKSQRCCDKHNDIYKKFVKQAIKEANKLGISDLANLIDKKYQDFLDQQEISKSISDFKISG